MKLKVEGGTKRHVSWLRLVLPGGDQPVELMILICLDDGARQAPYSSVCRCLVSGHRYALDFVFFLLHLFLYARVLFFVARSIHIDPVRFRVSSPSSVSFFPVRWGFRVFFRCRFSDSYPSGFKLASSFTLQSQSLRLPGSASRA